MNSGIVSGRYAKALFMHAKKYGKELEVYRETKWLSRCMTYYPQIKRILASPVVSNAKKQQMLEQLFTRPVSKEFSNFLRLILEWTREEQLHTICFMYQEYYRKEKNILMVELVTATPVAEQTKESIIKKMEKLTHEHIQLTTTIDPDIIGGYILYWDTYRWDASLAARMRLVRNSIKKKMINS